MKRFCLALLAFGLILSRHSTASAITLKELARQGAPKLFLATAGATMPNTTDQTNNLKEGEKCLLLSSQGLTDIEGISQLMVDDQGKIVPIQSVGRLHVFLNRNQISRIPDEIGELGNVVFLYFEHNQLHELPPSLAQMKILEGMYYTSNKFTEIPSFIFEMRKLRKLQFADNDISVLPAEIGNLKELRHFNMAKNRIGEIPETISKLRALKVCDLSDNPFTELPESFGSVPIAYQLRVRNCPITRLPEGFAAMTATIDITGSKIDPQTLSPQLQAKLSTEKASIANGNKLVSRPEKTPKPAKGTK
ncbi:leucine-rich repeat domain-containing protein [Planctomicrobium sp. SH664]|uniref:leucine-rich repeat domain-containing protein n=1 Tax=Planctomicrobium sp. SH664 TaxID=3448125 RepID=UPI003F5B0C47